MQALANDKTYQADGLLAAKGVYNRHMATPTLPEKAFPLQRHAEPYLAEEVLARGTWQTQPSEYTTSTAAPPQTLPGKRTPCNWQMPKPTFQMHHFHCSATLLQGGLHLHHI